MANRAAAEKVWMDFISSFEKQCLVGYIDDDGRNATRNKDLYESIFKVMDDKSFHDLMVRLRDGLTALPVFVPPMGDTRIDPDVVKAFGDKYGVKFYQRLISIDAFTGEEKLSHVEHLVLYQSVRRQSQHWEKKVSTNENNRKIDQLTGQATGESKAASISQPEATALVNKGYLVALTELENIRGGDAKALQFMLDQIQATGGFSVEAAKQLGTRPKVIESLQSLFNGMLLKTNI